MDHVFPFQGNVDSDSIAFISLCVKLRRWNNFYYFAEFNALKCLSELLLETFKKLEPILHCSFF